MFAKETLLERRDSDSKKETRVWVCSLPLLLLGCGLSRLVLF